MQIQSTWMMFFSQMLSQAPMLLVYVGGLIVCALMWRRTPTGAMLAIAGLGIMLIVTFAQSAITTYVITNRGAAPATSIANTMMWVGPGMSLIRAFGLALLIVGVFANRPRAADVSGFEVQPPPLR